MQGVENSELGYVPARQTTLLHRSARKADCSSMAQQLDKEGGGFPWLSLHTGEFRSCVYLLLAPPVFSSVQLPALPQSANAGDSDPLTGFAVAAPLCAHNGQKGLTGIL